MKRKLKITISVSAASLLSFTAFAQDSPTPKNSGAGYAHNRLSQTQRTDRLNGAAKASEIIGMTVNNYQNEKLGKVDNLIVDVESGRVVQVIISTGGFLGLGDALTTVPPGALHHDIVQKVLHLEADKNKLKNSPHFDNSQWATSSDSNRLAAVYGYYGEASSYNFIHRGGDASLDGQRHQEIQPIVEHRRNADGTADQDSNLARDEAWKKNRMARERQSMIPSTRLSQLQKASGLIGTPVKNLQDETLGKLEDLLVDFYSGRIVAVIVASGGFLGMGGELSAVPPTALRFNPERDTLQLDATKTTLTGAPHFNSAEWPDLTKPSYAEGVYRAYKVEPYFNANLPAEADNSGRNSRDQGGRNLTPLDQGNSSADVHTTAQVRKEILAGKNMSVNARNVKIITNGGQVTLRGPVNTAEEKRLIGEIANQIARSENVSNQLEVRGAPKSKN